MVEKIISADNNGGRSRLLSFLEIPPKILVLMLIIISFLTGYFFLAQPQHTILPVPTNLKIAKPSIDERWRGSSDAKIVLVEYLDLESAFSKSVHPTILKLLNENQGKVAWVIRHYALIPEHKKSQKLAEAVECAADQGGSPAFWKMTDAIYEKMPDLELTELANVAKSVGLIDVFLKTCLETNKFESKVKAEQTETEKIGFRMAPSTVIYNLSNDKTLLVEDNVPYEQFKSQLQDFMK